MSEEQATTSEILLYQTADGQSRVEVCLEDGTVWLSQRLLATLYQVSVRTANEHISNIYKERELSPEATIRKLRIDRQEGRRTVSRLVDFYNLDVILAVGYRVRSHRGAQFRRWAGERLREYLAKGFTIDGQRLRRGGAPGPGYFDELRERIRGIHTAERHFDQKLRDIYALAIDYDENASGTREFFRRVQDRFASAFPTAAEINRIVTLYLDHAEAQAERRRPLYMRDWREKLDVLLKFNQREVLDHAGRVAMEIARQLERNPGPI